MAMKPEHKLEAIRSEILSLQEQALYANLMDLVRQYKNMIEIIDRPEPVSYDTDLVKRLKPGCV